MQREKRQAWGESTGTKSRARPRYHAEKCGGISCPYSAPKRTVPVRNCLMRCGCLHRDSFRYLDTGADSGLDGESVSEQDREFRARPSGNDGGTPRWHSPGRAGRAEEALRSHSAQAQCWPGRSVARVQPGQAGTVGGAG